MRQYSGWDYLLIDLANAFGYDKKLFEERVEWAENYMHELESLAHAADNKPQYIKACMAIRKAQAGQPTGHMVGLDACCSGIQVMSALTGCVVGATHTGLVDPDVRADAYTIATNFMSEELTGSYTLNSGLVVSRSDAKDALMTMYYGSKKKPKEIFGEDTPELSAFYTAAQRVAPGAYELLGDLLASWQPHALVHSWKLPDGFDARVKVMVKQDARIEVDELNHATFTYEYYVNEGTESGLSNVANVVHSVDAYVLRSMHRRCNYDRDMMESVRVEIFNVLEERALYDVEVELLDLNSRLAYYVVQYERSGMADVVIVSNITLSNIHQLSTDHLEKLLDIIDSMLVHVPFPLVTVHDEFKAHANNMNHVRQHYINIFAELAESNLLSDILSQIHGKQGTFNKLSNNLGDLIRGSNYALS